MLELNKIYCMDCIEGMKQIDDNSVDTIITDPPYALGFMGKSWDTFDKSQFGRKGEEGENDLKVKKNFNILPRYKNWKGYYKFSFEWATEALRVAKPGATLLVFGGARTFHRLACAIEDAGWTIKDCIMWLYSTGFPKATNISLQLDKKIGLQGQRGIGGFNTGGMQEQANRKAKLYIGSKTDGSKLPAYDNPKSPEAQLWNGWKSHGLKPAYEPILVAMKPNEGSYAENALKYGVAGLNIDGSRIETDELTPRDNKNTKIIYEKGFEGKPKIIYPSPQGRFPANIILDEESAKMLDEQSGVGKSSSVGFNNIGWKHSGNKSDKMTNLEWQREYKDKGGASRFFYCAKASKSERNKGCEELDEKNIDYGERKGQNNSTHRLDGSERKPNISKNNHPTVKPLKLIKYLCILTKTPTGGIVLDPFAGSGTTGLACKKTGRDFILIEKEPEYVKIANARLNSVGGKQVNIIQFA